MSLNAFEYEWFWLYGYGTDYSTSAQFNFGPSYIWAYPVVQQHLERQGGDSQSDFKLNIIEKVVNGTPYHIDSQVEFGPGFTSITFGAYVDRCFVAGLDLINFFS